jgi:hypothetical protein
LNFGQTKWDKTQVLQGTSWGMHMGTLWELDGNMSGTHWKQGKKKQKILVLFHHPNMVIIIRLFWSMRISLPTPFPCMVHTFEQHLFQNTKTLIRRMKIHMKTACLLKASSLGPYQPFHRKFE